MEKPLRISSDNRTEKNWIRQQALTTDAVTSHSWFWSSLFLSLPFFPLFFVQLYRLSLSFFVCCIWSNSIFVLSFLLFPTVDWRTARINYTEYLLAKAHSFSHSEFRWMSLSLFFSHSPCLHFTKKNPSWFVGWPFSSQTGCDLTCHLIEEGKWQ